MKTSGRLLSLLSLLQSRRDWPGGLLAERLDVSARTVRRDVDRLRELGYPITTFRGPDGGYRLEAGSELPPLLFDDAQAVALSVALQLAARGGSGAGTGIEEDAVRALTTLRQVMPSRLRQRIDSIEVTPLDRSIAAASVDTALLTSLSTTIRAGETLRFDYASPGVPEDPGPARRAEPHHLVTRGGRWYLVAYDLDRDDWRTFRVDRIRPRTPNGPRFGPREVPGGDVAEFVAGRFRGAATGSAWPCRGEAVLDLAASEVVPYVHDGVVELLDDGRCRVVLGAWSWIALAGTFARFGAPFEVVGPGELRDACALLAQRFADAADGPVPGDPAPGGAVPA